MKSALVCGAGGFIGNHLVTRLKRDGFFVRGVDLKHPEFSDSEADEFVVADLRDPASCRGVLDRRFGEIYQLAAEMGGAGYIFTGDHDAAIMRNSAMINLNVLEAARERDCLHIFFSSSACVYPQYNQEDAQTPETRESTAYPANPDSDYGWEKLFGERIYLAYARNYGIRTTIARYHNIFGPFGTWTGGREKAPAAMCRKVAEAKDGGEIEMWGDGEQTRSFLYIDECLEGTLRLMRSNFDGPVNIGSEEMVTINQLAAMAMDIAGKRLRVKHIDGPLGVRGRNSNNDLIRERLRWEPSQSLRVGMERTYAWIEAQLQPVAKAISNVA
jgi:nucleoside-diphosphate-sugar epimerase